MIPRTENGAIAPDAIYFLLRIRGSSGAKIARDLKVSRNYISQVIYGVRKSPRVEHAIAKKLEMPATDIWPDRYERKAA